MVLKARICRALKWLGYPASSREFDAYASFRTHNLDVLLHLSGRETIIWAKHLAEWSVAAKWDPNARYRVVGTATAKSAIDMVHATNVLISVL